MLKKIDRMILKQFLPTLLVSVLFFVLVLEMVDLFSNLWRYINNEVSVKLMLKVFLFYIPKCINFSLPMALLFSVSYTLGNYYANNELIAIFGSGISLFRFVTSLIILGLLLSLGSFYFEEKVVIDSYKIKNQLSGEMLGRSQNFNNNHPTVIDKNGSVIYSADFYNDNDMTLSNTIVIQKDQNGDLLQIINSEWAEWNKTEEKWYFNRCRRYFYNNASGFYEMEYTELYEENGINADPFTFRKVVRDVDEMKVAEAKQWIASLKKAGLPYTESMTAYYKRFSFALTPFIVCLISSAVGGRFRKNILLMSLLTSLIISVVYYVMQMVFTILANLGYISPLTGAWIPFILFCLVGLFLYRLAHS